MTVEDGPEYEIPSNDEIVRPSPPDFDDEYSEMEFSDWDSI